MPTPTAVDLQTRFYRTGLGLPNILTPGVANPVVGGPLALGAIPPAPLPPATPVIYRGQHTRYRVENARIDLQEQVNGGNANLRTLAGIRNLPTGDTLYLPFVNDHITSIRLPVPAPAGVTFFFTDNLSGCKVFVDRINGSNDIMVYHANTTGNTAGPATYADFQNPAAALQLDAYHAAAQQDFAPGIVVNAASEIAMPRYFLSAGDEERRKFNQGRRSTAIDRQPRNFQGNQVIRTRPAFAGGCFICGFPTGGGWNIYFQTWGSVQYARPGYVKMLFTVDWTGVHNRRTKGAEDGNHVQDMAVLEQLRFHP